MVARGIGQPVAAEIGVHEHTVGKWCRRFLRARIEQLSDEPRPERSRTLTDQQVVAEVIERTLETTPSRSHALVDTIDGPGERAVARDDPADMGGLQRAAASHGDLQAVH